MPTISERELLGKLLLEEVLEYCQKGLGLELLFDGAPVPESCEIDLQHVEGRVLDNLEIIDGLADVNVVIHFAAHWHGFNLDKATSIVNDSNMSKLGSDGKPIINGVTPGYSINDPEGVADCEDGFDPNKPVGKILKSPNFVDPGPRLHNALIYGDLNNVD